MSAESRFQTELFPVCTDCGRAISEHTYDESLACWRLALRRAYGPYPDPPASPAWRIPASR